MSNPVQYDRQWIKRILKEEKCAINEMKTKVNPITGYSSKPASTYYEEQKYGGMDDKYSDYSGASKSAIDRAFAREYGDDDLELSSKWSVATPKTHISGKSNKSISKSSVMSSSKASAMSGSSQYSSQSAKKRVKDLEKTLNEEKLKRMDVEREIQRLKQDLLEMKK